MPGYLPLWEWLVQAAVLSLLVLSLGSGAVLLCREPVRRIRLIEVTLAACLVVPWLRMVPGLPEWSLPVPVSSLAPSDGSRNDTPQGVPDNGQAAEESGEPVNAGSEPVPREFPEAPPVAGKTADAEARPAIASGHRQAERPAHSGTMTGARNAALTSRKLDEAETAEAVRDVRCWLVVAYLSGAAALAGWIVLGAVGLARTLKTAKSADDACRAVLRELGGPAAERVRLLTADRVRQPFTVFPWKPVIVIPRELCAAVDRRALRWCLAHEWAHVERGDGWSWLLAGLGRLLFFYQPFVWWLRGRLRLAQDYLADARAAGLADAPEDYAEFLTTRATVRARRAAPGLGIGARPSALYRRVAMLLDNRKPLERRCPKAWTVAAVVVGTVLTGALSTLSPAPAASTSEEKTTETSDSISRERNEPARQPATDTDNVRRDGSSANRDPIEEPKWLSVQNLIVQPRHATLTTRKGGTNERACVCVRGLYPLQRQVRHVARALHVADAQAAKHVDLIDFHLERQKAEGKPAADEKVEWEDISWERVSLEPAIEVLESAASFAADIVPERVTDPVITMPLPELAEGKWGASVNHPRLSADEAGEKRPEYLLLRYIDFDVQPGHHYRYRVRLVLRNPNFARLVATVADPQITEGRTRTTPWTKPSPVAFVSAETDEASADSDAEGAEQESPDSAATDLPREDLRYGGKGFNEWRRTLLTDLEPETRVDALKAIGAFGANGYQKEAVAAIKQALKTDEPELNGYKVVEAAAKALGRIGKPGLSALAPLLRSDAPKVRALVARRLKQMGAKAEAAVPELIEALDDDPLQADPVAAWEALARIGEPRDKVVPALIKRLDRWAANNRTALIEKLEHKEVDRETAIAVLLHVLENDAYTLARAKAGTLLVRIGTNTAKVRQALVKMLISEKGQQYGPELVNEFRHSDVDVDLAVAVLAEVCQSSKLIRRHLRGGAHYLHLPGRRTRRKQLTVVGASLQGLRRLGAKAKGAVPALVKALDSPVLDEPEFGLAVKARFGRQIVQTLQAIGKPAVPELLKLAKPPGKPDALRRELRIPAITALGQIGSEAQAARPALEKMRDEQPQGLAAKQFQEAVRSALHASGVRTRPAIDVLPPATPGEREPAP